MSGAMQNIAIFKSAKLDNQMFEKLYIKYDTNKDGGLNQQEMLGFIKEVVFGQFDQAKPHELN